MKLAGTGSIADRLWNKPALSVIGIDAPSVELASNTLIPAARAKISLRLAPGQDPDRGMDALAAHVAAHAPFGAEATFVPGERGQAFATDTSASAARTRCGRWNEAWGTSRWRRDRADRSRSSPT